MSYVRFSSDDGKSDVYVYEDVTGGWTTMVAGRAISNDPLPGYTKEEGLLDFFYAKEYTHPDSDTKVNHDTPQECADNLERLRKEGFHVPQYAIDRLREETT